MSNWRALRDQKNKVVHQTFQFEGSYHVAETGDVISPIHFRIHEKTRLLSPSNRDADDKVVSDTPKIILDGSELPFPSSKISANDYVVAEDGRKFFLTLVTTDYAGYYTVEVEEER